MCAPSVITDDDAENEDGLIMAQVVRSLPESEKCKNKILVLTSPNSVRGFQILGRLFRETNIKGFRESGDLVSPGPTTHFF